MIKVLRTLHLKEYWQRYPETESALKAWLLLGQERRHQTLKDLLSAFPEAYDTTNALTFPITDSTRLFATFQHTLRALWIRAISNLYSSHPSSRRNKSSKLAPHTVYPSVGDTKPLSASSSHSINLSFNS